MYIKACLSIKPRGGVEFGWIVVSGVTFVEGKTVVSTAIRDI